MATTTSQSSIMMILLLAVIAHLPLLTFAAVVDPTLIESSLGHAKQRPLSPDFNRVPVTLGVMSRCADAHLCEKIFNDVIEEVGHDIIDLKLQFVAKLDESEAHYGVKCKHGPLECAGNVHELCVAQHSGGSKKWWPFVQCINNKTVESIGEILLAESCTGDVGLDWEKDGIKECIEGDEGVDLLKENVEKTGTLGITCVYFTSVPLNRH
ncbi:hypothetical protein FRC03_008683 [Tulasnella sp. 419]|nr:hypothetical protein FRC03_008683 [Tulasnella sp. 419]